MLSEQDFEYAIENTRIIRAPRTFIETFGTTQFPFILITEMLDDAHQVRIRKGLIEAERPRLISPSYFRKLLLEGFGEAAREFADWLEDHPDLFKILRYGFTLKKTDLNSSLMPGSLESASEAILRSLPSSDTETALISGVDENWEICLLKFTTDLIRGSASENLDEWRRRGLI